MKDALSLKFKFDYAATDPLINVDLTVPSHGITGVMGPSGVGKTTFLKCVAGLLSPKSGEVIFQNELWYQQDNKTKYNLPVEQRNLGFVFQSNNFLAHLTIQENIEYALKRSQNSLSSNERNLLILRLGCENLLSKQPHQLSGGEQQRVALLKTLICRPRLILLDEPLSAIDLKSREVILDTIVDYQKQHQIPMFWVTHSLIEMQQFASQLIYLSGSRVEFHSNPGDLINDIFIAKQLDEKIGVSIAGTIKEHMPEYNMLKVATRLGELLAPFDKEAYEQLEQVKLRFRVLACNVGVSRQKQTESSVLNQWSLELRDIKAGSEPGKKILVLREKEQVLLSEITHYSLVKLDLKVGQRVWANVKSVLIN